MTRPNWPHITALTLFLTPWLLFALVLKSCS